MNPIPTVKGKERSRTKSGRWRKKRSDKGKTREKKIKIKCSVCGNIQKVRKSWWWMYKPKLYCLKCELIREFKDVEK